MITAPIRFGACRHVAQFGTDSSYHGEGLRVHCGPLLCVNTKRSLSLTAEYFSEHAPLKHGTDIEPVCNSGDVRMLSSEREGRGTRRDLQLEWSQASRPAAPSGRTTPRCQRRAQCLADPPGRLRVLRGVAEEDGARRLGPRPKRVWVRQSLWDSPSRLVRPVSLS